MKKIVLSIASCFAMMSAFADGGTNTRKHCLWGDRYMAWASVSKLTGANPSNSGFYVYMVVGFDPYGQPVYQWVWHPGGSSNSQVWQEVARDRRDGCTRPKQADVIYNTTIPGYGNGHAEAHSLLTFSGGSLSKSTNHWMLKPGNFRGAVIDPVKLSRTNLVGSSNGSVDGSVEINSTDNGIDIVGLSGHMEIANQSNFYSTYRVVVVKEDQNISQQDFIDLTEGYKQFVYPNIVAEGSITLTKEGFVTTGILDGLFNNTRPSVSNGNYMVNFSNVNGSISLNRSVLGPNEEFALITYIDGGFNYSLIAPDDLPVSDPPSTASKSSSSLGVVQQIKGDVLLTPNPASNMVSLAIPSDMAKTGYSLTMVDNMGRQLMGGNHHKEEFVNFDVSTLPNGIYFLNVSAGGKVTSHKFVVSH